MLSCKRVHVYGSASLQKDVSSAVSL